MPMPRRLLPAALALLLPAAALAQGQPGGPPVPPQGNDRPTPEELARRLRGAPTQREGAATRGPRTEPAPAQPQR